VKSTAQTFGLLVIKKLAVAFSRI